MPGRAVTDFVAANDRPLVRQLLRQVNALYRIDPAVLRMLRPDGTSCGILLGGCRLPDRSDSLFLSVALVPDALAAVPRPRDAATGLLTADALRAAAQRISAAR